MQPRVAHATCPLRQATLSLRRVALAGSAVRRRSHKTQSAHDNSSVTSESTIITRVDWSEAAALAHHNTPDWASQPKPRSNENQMGNNDTTTLSHNGAWRPASEDGSQSTLVPTADTSSGSCRSTGSPRGGQDLLRSRSTGRQPSLRQQLPGCGQLPATLLLMKLEAGNELSGCQCSESYKPAPLSLSRDIQS